MEGTEEEDLGAEGMEGGGARRTVIEELAVEEAKVGSDEEGAEAGGGEGEGRGAGRFPDRRETLTELTPGFDLLWRAGVPPYIHLCLSFKHITQR
jgi:hypothetical protein